MKPIAVALAVLGLCAPSLLLAQELPMFPQPVKEHEVLKQFVGEWNTMSEGVAGPDQPAMKCEGKIKSKMLGGFWVVNEMESNTPGFQMTGLQTVGYDMKSKKYVGTWVDSMMNHMWKYEGNWDEAGKVLTLQAEGPNFMEGGKSAQFRDIYQFKTKDQIAISSQMQGEDGKWVTFMTGTATRKK
jgi:hypothetical protein